MKNLKREKDKTDDMECFNVELRIKISAVDNAFLRTGLEVVHLRLEHEASSGGTLCVGRKVLEEINFREVANHTLSELWKTLPETLDSTIEIKSSKT